VSAFPTSKNRFQAPFVIVGIMGVSAVILGALGAHALKDTLGSNLDSWQTAAQYHILHTVALLALVIGSRGRLLLPGVLWIGGVVLFSGSIYILALGGPKWLGPITPIGGVLFILGWLSLVFPGIQRQLKG
jgi:uncharacterized membrane protein YgdD (TMEM256/DUF423 family)